MYSFRDLYCSSYLHKLCSKSYQRAKCGVQLPVALINFHVPLVLPRVRVVGLFFSHHLRGGLLQTPEAADSRPGYHGAAHRTGVRRVERGHRYIQHVRLHLHPQAGRRPAPFCVIALLLVIVPSVLILGYMWIHSPM